MDVNVCVCVVLLLCLLRDAVLHVVGVVHIAVDVVECDCVVLL